MKESRSCGFERRRDAQREWLRVNHPDVFEEQKHLDAGSVERAYWHYGYTVALGDVLRFLERDEVWGAKPSVCECKP